MGKEDGTGKIHPEHSAVIPNAKYYPTMDAYGHYRFGLTMAGMPPDNEAPKVSPYGPIGEHPFSSAYSDADQKIIDMASKLCGFTPHSLGNSKSEELEGTHKASPVNHNSGVHKKGKTKILKVTDEGITETIRNYCSVISEAKVKNKTSELETRIANLRSQLRYDRDPELKQQLEDALEELRNSQTP